MPRRPSRRFQLVKYQPLTFSSFARSIAQIATVNRLRHESKVQKMELQPKSAGKELMNNDMESEDDEVKTSDGEEIDGVVQADFVFFDPKPDDFHGVKALLLTYLDNKQWDLSGFVDLILGQTTVGTVVKIEDDEENAIWSFVTALNLYRYKEHKCIMELKEYLLTACHEKDFSNDLRSLLVKEARNVGLLVSQRTMSLPHELLPPQYDALFDEVSWATEDEPTKELQKSFCFKYYIVICQIGKRKNTSQKKRHNSNSEEEIIYRKPEDEIFHKLSLWSISFPMQTEQLLTQERKNYRLMGLVMAIEAEKIPTFRHELHALIDKS